MGKESGRDFRVRPEAFFETKGGHSTRRHRTGKGGAKEDEGKEKKGDYRGLNR